MRETVIDTGLELDTGVQLNPVVIRWEFCQALIIYVNQLPLDTCFLRSLDHFIDHFPPRVGRILDRLNRKFRVVRDALG